MSDSWRDKVDSRRVEFPNADGERLSAILDRPKGKVTATAVFSHCFTCSKQYKVAVHLGRMLALRGVALLRYDFPGLGRSEGDFSRTTFQGYVSDVRHAAEFVATQERSPRVLFGHSFGGGASLAAAGALKSVDLVVTLAATADPAEMRPGFKEAYEEAQSTGLGRLTTAGNTYELRREFFETLQKVDLEPSVRSLRPHLLAVHDPDDRIVPFENAERLVKWAPRSELMTLEGAGHLFADDDKVQRIVERVLELLDDTRG